MNPSGLENFIKLWGKIEKDLTPGSYYITIYNKYDSSSFNGHKSIFISTCGIFGGKNLFL